MRITLQKLILTLTLAIGTPVAFCASAATSAPGTIAINTSGIVYYAQAGDTLMSIAQRLTTKIGNWTELGKLNRVNKDVSIPIGTGIIIPTELLKDEPSEATVIARTGSIKATTGDGTPLQLDIGAKIVEGTRIATSINSFLTLQLPDTSRVSLPSNSSIELAKLRKSQYTGAPRTELKLTRGKVVSRVSPLDVNKGRFEVHTPQSVAGVRGTYFRVGLNGTKAANEVIEGHVLVGSQQDPQVRMLNAAKGNIIEGKSIGPAIDLLQPPQLASEPYRQSGAAQFELTQVEGARAFHVQIAQDAEMLNLLAEATGNSNNVSIDNIQEGNYFVRLTAIDKLGLEGLPRTFAATIRNRVKERDDASLPAPSVAQSDAKEMVLRWTGSATQKYNIQVARDLDFSWLQFTTSVIGNEIRFPRPSFGTYYTRVQSVNADGSTGLFSFAQTLIVTDQWIINDGRPVRSKDANRSAGR
jgi:hypothetical protein